MFFAIFGFFLKIYQNMGQKLGSNHTGYWFWLKGIAGRDLRLAQPHADFGFGSRRSPDGVSGQKEKKGFSLQSLLCKTLRSFAS